MQIICTSLQTDNYASKSPLKFFYRQNALPVAQPTASKHWRHKATGMFFLFRNNTDNVTWWRKEHSKLTVEVTTYAHQSHGRHNEWLVLTVYVHCHPDTMSEISSECQFPKSCPNTPWQHVAYWTYKQCKIHNDWIQNTPTTKILLLERNQHFYLNVSISITDLHQKKFVQFLFRFLPW